MKMTQLMGLLAAAAVLSVGSASVNAVTYGDDFEGGANATGWGWVFATSTVMATVA